MKQITIPYDGKEYTLEYTRNSVKQMEGKGFNIQELAAKPVTYLPMMFEGAFYSKHKYVKQEVVRAIYDNLKNKDDILATLTEMYQDVLLATVGNTEENEGNIAWEKNW